jgi:hypothetical protein
MSESEPINSSFQWAKVAPGDQTTTYAYGSNTTFSGVARKDLLDSINYPDSVSSSDSVTFTYSRQGRKTGTFLNYPGGDRHFWPFGRAVLRSAEEEVRGTGRCADRNGCKPYRRMALRTEPLRGGRMLRGMLRRQGCNRGRRATWSCKR